MSKKNRSYDGKGKQTSSLTSGDLITQLLVQSFDPVYRDSIYSQMRYAFGEPWANGTGRAQGNHGDGEFPDYEDIYVRHQEIGRSRRIINNQFIGLSRVMYADPQPESPQVDKYTGEVRKQAYLTRYREDEWGDEMAMAFMDGNGLGLGFVQVCLRTNTETGEQRVHLRHSPLILTLWDRFERSPGRARWIAFVRYLPLEEAEMIFGKETARENVRMVRDGHSTWGVEMVRYFEYYDIGVGNGSPTRAIILGNLRNTPWKIEDNAFGSLPMAYYCHFYAPGMRYPIGRISLQMNTQEAINEIERALRRTLRKGPVTIVDPDQLDDDDLKQYNNGDQSRAMKWKIKPGRTEPPLQHVPGAEISQSALHLYEMMDKQNTTDSGVTDFDKGIQPQSSRTLGEDMLVDQRGQTQASWDELQAMKFHVRSVRKVFSVMERFDRDPMTLDIFGKSYTVNDPARPASTIDRWLADTSDVIINTDQLRYQDVQQVRTQRLQQLLQVANFVGPQGALDLRWFAEELARALGEQDPKQAMNSALVQMQAQPGAAVPGVPVPGAPAPGGAPTQPVMPQQSVMPGQAAPPPLSDPGFRTPPMAPGA